MTPAELPARAQFVLGISMVWLVVRQGA